MSRRRYGFRRGACHNLQAQMERLGGGTRLIVVFQAEAALVHDRVQELVELEIVGLLRIDKTIQKHEHLRVQRENVRVR